MITLYTGTPGSGKSFHLIKVILKNLSLGRMVISNFPIKFTAREKKRKYHERFYYMQNEEITIQSLVEFALDQGMIEKGKESQCMVIIDEAGGRFNCREFTKSDRKEWIDFFSQHRKLGFDFIMSAQNDRMLDRQIRGFVETEKMHRKVNNFGPFQFLPAKVFVSIEIWYTAKQRVGAEWILFSKRIANHYDTMQMFSGFTLSPELLKKIENKRNGICEELPKGIDVGIDAVFIEESGGTD